MGTFGKLHLIWKILARLGNIGTDGDLIHVCADFLIGFERLFKVDMEVVKLERNVIESQNLYTEVLSQNVSKLVVVKEGN